MIENKLIKIIKNTFETDQSIDLMSTKNDISNWDSIGHLNLILDIEEEFDISFSKDEIESIKSVSTLLKLVNSKLS
jgi:acyl carrier protein